MPYGDCFSVGARGRIPHAPHLVAAPRAAPYFVHPSCPDVSVTHALAAAPPATDTIGV